MEKTLIAVIFLFIIIAGVVWLFQYYVNRKVRRAVKLIIRWFDYIVSHPNDLDISEVRRIGDIVDEYIAENDIGKNTMYFTPKLIEHIVDRFGRKEHETFEQAAERLIQWRGDNVKFESYWTIIRGSFAEYISRREKGETPDLTAVSAPVAVLRKYWRV
ncbi:MAG: hypothetical protein DRP16_06020 [Candidatus Aenigmatarchaeota archaeon]|nr:MAG: hypothetical protein DRP16_06020 [Candidatus Aenigmarchaeota archaeon]